MVYEKLLNISEVSKLLGVAPSTLRRMEKDNVVEGYGLQVIYTPGGQRRYLLEEIQQLFTNQGFSGSLGFGKKAALLIRDLTSAFLEPHSKLAIEVDKQIEATKKLAETAVQQGIPVIFSITVNNPSAESKLWFDKFPALKILEDQSPWIKMHPELENIEYNLINKTPYITDLYRSPVIGVLQKHQVDTLVLAGASTSGSIRATAIDALQQGYRVIIPKEAVGDRNNAIQTSTLLDLNARYADVVGVDHVLKVFKMYQGSSHPS